MTLDEFSDYIYELKDEFKNRDLEEYLLALYKNLLDNRIVYMSEEPSFELILCVLKECFGSEPALFDENWLSITECPDANRLSRKFTNHDLKDEFDRMNMSVLQGMEFTLEVLKFQIAELHKMRDKQLKDEYRYFGIDSETGHRWYNFDPFANLGCGVSCMLDNDDEITVPDWSFIGNLLEDGRIYE